MGEIKIEPLVSTEDLEKLFGLSKDSLDKARKELGLPFYNIGRLVKFRASEVERWLKERKVNG